GYAMTFMYPRSYSRDSICRTRSARRSGSYSASCRSYSSSYFLSQMKLSVAPVSLGVAGSAAHVGMDSTTSGSGLTDQPSKARSYSPASHGSVTLSRQLSVTPIPRSPHHSWRYLPMALSFGSVAWHSTRYVIGLPSLPTRLPSPSTVYPASSRSAAAFSGSYASSCPADGSQKYCGKRGGM